jgi:quercetin dioxygenase-like cupin family protein
MMFFWLPQEDNALRERANRSASGRAAATLVKQGGLRVALVALRKGAVLRAHAVAAPVCIQTLRGCVRIGSAERENEVLAGGLVALGPRELHTVEALQDCAILVTVAMP